MKSGLLITSRGGGDGLFNGVGEFSCKLPQIELLLDGQLAQPASCGPEKPRKPLPVPISIPRKL